MDVTSTGTSTALNNETLELTPTGRNGLVSLLAQAPGVRTRVDVGGSSVSEPPTFRAFGQSGESFQLLDGLLTTSSKNTQSGNFYDYSSFEETRVQAIGNDVEVPVRGISVTSVLKSGSNQFHGGAFWSQTSDRFQNSNLDDELRAQGVTAPGELVTRWDGSAEMGGKVVESKLWIYGSTRFRENSLTVLTPSSRMGRPPSIRRRKRLRP